MIIRIAPTKRLTLIEELNNQSEFFPEDPIDDIQDHSWFLAKIGTQVVGWSGYKIKSEEEVEIYRTGVLPAFQNQGIKRKMVRAMERHAKGRGYLIMKSYCDIDNVTSANSLISSGYKLYNPATPYCDGPWIYWKKRLV